MPNQAIDKQEAILQTALVLFAERGFYGTPTSLISKKAGVAAGTLFFYFKTKGELIDALYCRIKNEMAQEICQNIDTKKSATENLHIIWRSTLLWFIENPEKLKFLEQFAHSPFVSTSAYEEAISQLSPFKELIKEGIKNGEIRDVPLYIITGTMASTLQGLANCALLTDNMAKREKIIEDGFHLIWYGIKG